MKTYTEIRAALKRCVIGPSAQYPRCGDCPYMYEPSCSDKMLQDTREMLKTLHHDNIRLKAALEGKNV